MDEQRWDLCWWGRFSDYDNIADGSVLGMLILDNFASLSVPGPCTHRQIVERIAEGSRIRIPIDSLPEVLEQTVLPRGNVVFGCPGKYFDQIAENYPGMQWWLTEKGLRMEIIALSLHERLAVSYGEVEQLSPQKRGFAFEKFLDMLFGVCGLSPRKSFRLSGEQVDGSFQLDHDTYLVEAKWQEDPIGNRELQSFSGTVRAKAEWARGLYVSNSGFSEDGIGRFGQGNNTRIICLAGIELREIFANKLDLATVLRMKVRRAAESGHAYIPVRELFKLP